MWMQYKELTTMDYHGRYKLGWMVKGERSYVISSANKTKILTFDDNKKVVHAIVVKLKFN